jgi:hypothetical protein
MDNTEKTPTLADLFPTMNKFLPLFQERLDDRGITATEFINTLMATEPIEIRQLPIESQCSWLFDLGETHLIRIICGLYPSLRL